MRFHVCGVLGNAKTSIIEADGTTTMLLLQTRRRMIIRSLRLRHGMDHTLGEDDIEHTDTCVQAALPFQRRYPFGLLVDISRGLAHSERSRILHLKLRKVAPYRSSTHFHRAFVPIFETPITP